MSSARRSCSRLVIGIRAGGSIARPEDDGADARREPLGISYLLRYDLLAGHIGSANSLSRQLDYDVDTMAFLYA